MQITENKYTLYQALRLAQKGFRIAHPSLPDGSYLYWCETSDVYGYGLFIFPSYTIAAPTNYMPAKGLPVTGWTLVGYEHRYPFVTEADIERLCK